MQPKNTSIAFNYLEQIPHIYIPMLFLNITETKLRAIIAKLDIFTPNIISFEEKRDLKNNKCNCVFITVKAWHQTTQGQQMRSKLLHDQEVKIVFDDPWYFICKRKHEEGDIAVSPAAVSTNDFHLAEVPRHVRGVSRNLGPSHPDYCPECEDGVENQMGHTCVWRMMEEGSSSDSVASSPQTSPQTSPQPSPQPSPAF